MCQCRIDCPKAFFFVGAGSSTFSLYSPSLVCEDHQSVFSLHALVLQAATHPPPFPDYQTEGRKSTILLSSAVPSPTSFRRKIFALEADYGLATLADMGTGEEEVFGCVRWMRGWRVPTSGNPR